MWRDPMTNRIFNRHFLFTAQKLFKQLLIIHFFCILLFCFFTMSLGQESIEERESALRSLPQDTHRVDILWRLSYDISASDPKKAELYALEAIELGKKLNYSLGLAKSYTALAISFYVRGDYASHSENLQKALDLYREMDDQEGEAKILNNLGASYYARGNFQKSLEFYFKALEISEEKILTSLHARVLNNIGEIYEKLKNPDQALEYYEESYKIFSPMEGVESEKAYILLNIGKIHSSKGNLDFAIQNYDQALSIFLKLDEKLYIAECYRNIGEVFFSQKNQQKALEYLNKSLEIREEIQDKNGIAECFLSIGSIHSQLNNHSLSKSFSKKSLDLAIEIGAKEIEMKALQNLSDQELAFGNHASALNYFKKYTKLKDSMLGIETIKQLAELQTKYDFEQAGLENTKLRMENELHEQTIQKQIYIGILVTACLGLVIILAIVFFKGQQKQKNIRLLLAEKTAYIDQLFESAQEAIVMADKDGRVLRMNDEFTRLFGYTIKEVLGKTLDNLIASEEYQDEASEVTKKVAKGEKVTFETVRQSKNGTKIQVSVLGSPIIVEDKMVAVYGIYRDITDRKKSEKALQYSIKQWQTTFDAMNDPVCILDEDYKISRCNQAMLDYLGKSNNDIIGQYSWKIIHGTEENIKDCPAEKSRQTKTREKLVLKMGKKWIDFTADPILDESGKVKEVVHILSDITTRKQAEEALNKHTEELEMFNKAMVDRENRIIEMKEEVNNLCEKLGQKHVYPQIWLSENHDKKSQQ